ncbi:MAG: bifunctional ornithine acetyltransferase/N-acetylglutamate synthase [Sedimentibacter saalensis]|jgi:glutamate N-acetyltransferase/amino-acid N-acetyltransferase|uniref:bifunctional ornithine acetyltransferase/N-acetylglutamate synthase n=1 Tax=Sedimentibacter saalensis TaxID=130788 RepID=UPI002B208E51|nr:bifunctional ornithine acetyltransferase/N-acetylglutamate synthase [Sedimentibacter saalensis]MEA5094793.1 bifunctional ornithine acetyltransferase/N-acetylglutamate synthase [Sedimentibacter saalensis]
MKEIEGGVTSPKGFKAAGVFAGIRKKKKDMAMIFSEVPCIAAGTFTTNIVKAAPVKWDMEMVKKSPFVQAVVVNSGVANTCTGATGMGYCRDMAVTAGLNLGIPTEAVLVASTGLIGKQIPIDKIKTGIENLVPILGSSKEDGIMAAEAILTTDTRKKELAVEIELSGKKVIIGGMCKGSGMIHPNMCTMLSFITTDAAISKELLQEALSTDVKETYNMISVDGDTSTNDTVLLLANGLAGNHKITEKNEDYEKFAEALNFVNTYFAKRIAEDGEGATSLFEVKVINALTKEQAMKLSKSIVSSNLTKAAIFGHDLNWGRILCAMGYSGAEFEPDDVDLYFESSGGKIKLIENGIELIYSKEAAEEILSKPEITVIADIKMGNQSSTAWGCDLTYDYVRINAAYGS